MMEVQFKYIVKVIVKYFLTTQIYLIQFAKECSVCSGKLTNKQSIDSNLCIMAIKYKRREANTD